MTLYKFKIVVVGDYAVGKTTLIINYTEKTFRGMYIPTVGVQFTKNTFKLDGNEVELTIWDITGQEKFAKVRKTFYENAAGFIIVYDLTRKSTLENIINWYKDVLEITDNIPCVVIGNKNDLKSKREINTDNISKVIEKKKMNINVKFETSAKTGENVNQGFNSLIQQLINK